MMNFTFVLEMPSDREWGVKRDDGTWTGQVGLLSQDKVDIGKTLCTIEGHSINW